MGWFKWLIKPAPVEVKTVEPLPTGDHMTLDEVLAALNNGSDIYWVSLGGEVEFDYFYIHVLRAKIDSIGNGYVRVSFYNSENRRAPNSRSARLKELFSTRANASAHIAQMGDHWRTKHAD